MILDGPTIASLTARLSDVDSWRAVRYPGSPGRRQPVHTCYVPANRLTPATPREWGEQAVDALDRHRFDLSADLADRVRAKLAGEPVEDLRIFASLGQMPELVRDHPFLRGTRVTLGLTNLFDAKQDVHDATGTVPLSYQPDYLDPLGRRIVVSFRKQF